MCPGTQAVATRVRGNSLSDKSSSEGISLSSHRRIPLEEKDSGPSVSGLQSNPKQEHAIKSHDSLVAELRHLQQQLRLPEFTPLLERLRAVKEVLTMEEKAAVAAMREALRAKDLLPPEHDDAFHLMR